MKSENKTKNERTEKTKGSYFLVERMKTKAAKEICAFSRLRNGVVDKKIKNIIQTQNGD